MVNFQLARGRRVGHGLAIMSSVRPNALRGVLGGIVDVLLRTPGRRGRDIGIQDVDDDLDISHA